MIVPEGSGHGIGRGSVILAIHLAMEWKDSYSNKYDEEIQDLITALENAVGILLTELPGTHSE